MPLAILQDTHARLLPVNLQLQVWKATVYLTPLLGAFLADAYMGRYWVILVFSIIYFIVRPSGTRLQQHP
jgi:glycine/D-amino acid oxidase-like deaminating enzyme